MPVDRFAGSPRLFPLVPIGMGTVEVESLASYACRLAIAHGVTVGQLLQYVHEAWLVNSNGSASCDLNEGGYFYQINELNRPTEAAKKFRQQLAGLTGVEDLVQTTFVPLAGSLDRCQKTFSPFPRWCTACLRETEIAGGPSYYQLIWQIRDVSHCPVHGIELSDKCPTCGSNQGTRSHRVEAHCCQNCGVLLSTIADNNSVEKAGPSDSVDLVRLLKEYSHLPKGGVSPREIRESMDQFFGFYWEKEREDEIYRLFGRDRWLSILHGHAPLTLRTLRQTAYTLGIDIYDLVTGNLKQMPLDIGHSSRAPKAVFMHPRRRSRYDRDAVLDSVRWVMKKSDQPLGLGNIAQEVGVSKGYMRYQFPVLTGQLIEAKKCADAAELRRQRRQAVAAILEYRRRVAAQGASRGTKKMVDALHNEHGLSKYLLRQTWKEIQYR